MAASVLWLFLTVPWVGLQCVIVVFPDHNHLHLPTDRFQAVVMLMIYCLMFIPLFVGVLCFVLVSLCMT